MNQAITVRRVFTRVDLKDTGVEDEHAAPIFRVTE